MTVATERQRRGASAEELARAWLAGQGWQILARNVRLGRDEIDLVAIEADPTPVLVLVEVRSAQSSAFGAPEERVDRRKVSSLYRAAAAFVRSGAIRQLHARGLPVRVDLIVVDLRLGRPKFRHLRRVEPA